ncbi:transposase [Moorena sp. SIO3F7]|uniref:transposase n=1 Tax=unclassified Moorena TaxID=2683338 RepID=UPI00344D2F33
MNSAKIIIGDLSQSEIMPDHVHMFLEVDPTYAPSVIIKRVKGRASHHLRREFHELLKLPTLWSPSAAR